MAYCLYLRKSRADMEAEARGVGSHALAPFFLYAPFWGSVIHYSPFLGHSQPIF